MIPGACQLLPKVHPGVQYCGCPTAVTSSKVLFRWSQAADEAFQHLKSGFLSAPILLALDPGRQFVVEVDASYVAMEAVLS